MDITVDLTLIYMNIYGYGYTQNRTGGGAKGQVHPLLPKRRVQ